jgi:hypothetical protein
MSKYLIVLMSVFYWLDQNAHDVLSIAHTCKRAYIFVCGQKLPVLRVRLYAELDSPLMKAFTRKAYVPDLKNGLFGALIGVKDPYLQIDFKNTGKPTTQRVVKNLELYNMFKYILNCAPTKQELQAMTASDFFRNMCFVFELSQCLQELVVRHVEMLVMIPPPVFLTKLVLHNSNVSFMSELPDTLQELEISKYHNSWSYEQPVVTINAEHLKILRLDGVKINLTSNLENVDFIEFKNVMFKIQGRRFDLSGIKEIQCCNAFTSSFEYFKLCGYPLSAKLQTITTSEHYTLDSYLVSQPHSKIK